MNRIENRMEISMDIRSYLQNNKLLCDGAFGTYYIASGGKCSIVEEANISEPEFVKSIHKKYIEAGAHLIRTNTFASNCENLSCGYEELSENIKAGYMLAKSVASEYENVFVAGDIGPVSCMFPGEMGDIVEEYKRICDAFLECGADILVFETMDSPEYILDVIKQIKQKKDVFIIVQFCVNQYGYSNAGRSAKSLIDEVATVKEIDAVGFNCGVGPLHLYNIINKLNMPKDKYITALPNAGYPKRIQNRMIFMENEEYFVDKVCEIIRTGVDIIGGCCGTTPDYIRKLNEKMKDANTVRDITLEVCDLHDKSQKADKSFFAGVEAEHKLIAVELAPPLGADDGKIMDAANLLKNANVDVVTFPDSPSGRTRADSILMALKVMNATGLCVMPHICCRDKNSIAIRAQMLGAYMNGIYNMLVLTGDPVPTMIRQSVKSVFNFDSVGMMRILKDMNEEEFKNMPLVYGGVINYDRLNIEVEIKRVARKMQAGAKFFFTQPIFTQDDAQKVRLIKNETGAKILCGIMPLVSRKNAIFIKNEMTGIRVTDSIVEMFDENMSREQGENVGVKIAKNVMSMVNDFADGFYFTFPFNRVYLLDKIL